MRRVFFTLGIIVLVTAAAAVYFIMFRMDSMVETRIEKAASMVFGSRVEVGGVKTNLRDGTLTVEQISVANPPGYENPYAVRLNAVHAAVDYEGLEIKRVVIGNPEFYVEEHDGKTNFDQMLQALDAEHGLAATERQGNEPVIVIRHLRIDETRAGFESHTFDRYTDMKIDAIEMNDLRGTPSQLAEQIARKVVKELNSETESELFKAKAQRQLDDLQKKVDNKLRDLLDEAGDDDSAD